MASSTPKQHKLFWGSSYDRGLDNLLFMWPAIKEKYQDAELHICYGWDLFDKVMGDNPERRNWKATMVKMMSQDGIYHYGRVGKSKLKEVRKQCGIWAYPTYFAEINCITALDAQSDGLVPVVIDLAALHETVGVGIKVSGDIKNYEVQKMYLEELLDIMGDKERWKKESIKAERFARDYHWENISNKWIEVFEKPVETPKVSVITVTNRPGFWNIMADNLSKQTYKNFEWIIVDDYAEDRSEIAQKYADKHNLTIRYLRGDKISGTYPRRYGLVRANNQGWKAATGELTVWIQDFILIPETGIEWLVDIYRHNPKSLIAPTDKYYFCTKPDLENKEDWWGGVTNVITEKSWTNIRNEGLGIRQTENPFDFEMNYSAIPIHIIKHLNGWWESFDDGLGYDNTEFAYRALQAGYKILIDDTNVAAGIDLDPILGKVGESIDRNHDRYKKFLKMDLPPVRDEKLDK